MCVCCSAPAFLTRQCFPWWVFLHCLAWEDSEQFSAGGVVCVCVCVCVCGGGVCGGITQPKLLLQLQPLLLPALLLLLLLLLQVVLDAGCGVDGWIDEWVLE